MEKNFFDKVLVKYFGISKQELAFSTLIIDSFAKERLQTAEAKIKESKYLEAIVECKDAFDYAKFNHSYAHQSNIWNEPGFFEAKQNFTDLHRLLITMNDMILLSSTDVDVPKYYQYMEYVECIPSEYTKDWHSNRVLQRDWQKADADFCYSFVSSTILNWESNAVQRIDTQKQVILQ